MNPLELAVVVLGAPLVVLNLALTLGVLARLRAVQQRLDNQTLDPTLVARGTHIGAFRATTVGGTALSEQTLVDLGQVLVGFFSPGCGPCVQLKEQLAANPPKLPMIAVIDGAPDSPAVREYGRVFEKFAQVTFGGPDAAISKAFQASSYPTLVRLRGAVVAASGNTLAVLG
ncbi:MAG: hypothetical protein IPJ65_15520 [Archangiaceae bacterium]|nr:hypothetical protein [Archangiaceae bacterium]